MAKKHYPESEVKARGKKGTYYTKYEGVGLGYEIDGIVVRSGGDGWYYEVKDLEKFVPDQGKGYMAKVRQTLSGYPLYWKGVKEGRGSFREAVERLLNEQEGLPAAFSVDRWRAEDFKGELSRDLVRVLRDIEQKRGSAIAVQAGRILMAFYYSVKDPISTLYNEGLLNENALKYMVPFFKRWTRGVGRESDKEILERAAKEIENWLGITGTTGW